MTDPIARTARYQDDLARLLAALEPAERAEVLDGVREHIDAALAELDDEPTDADVNRILGKLGSPGAVAEAALAERPGTPVPAGGQSTVDAALERFSSALIGRWVPPVALLALLIGGGLGLWGLPLLLALIGVVMVIGSPLWIGKEKLWASIGLPVCSVMILGSFFLYGLGGTLGEVVRVIAFVIFAGGALAILVVLWFRGARRASQYVRHPAARTQLGEQT